MSDPFDSPYQIELAHCPACAAPSLRRVRRPSFLRMRHSSRKRKRPVYGLSFCCPFSKQTLGPAIGLHERAEIPAIRDAWLEKRGIESAPPAVRELIAAAEALEKTVFGKAA